MSEKKNVIEIPLPKGYEQCELKDATHILLGRSDVCRIERGKEGTTYFNLHTERHVSHRVVHAGFTAFIREVSKPEPFRVVTTGTASSILHKLDPNGEASEGWILRLDSIDLKDGERYRVTIEEVLPNE